MTNTPGHGGTSADIEELRAERDWLLRELQLARGPLAGEERTQYAAYRQLVELERARAFDEISRGIEHRLFNKLTPVEGFAELLLADDKRAPNPAKVKGYLQIILEAAKDAKGVVESMRESYFNVVHSERHQTVSEMLPNGLNQTEAEESAAMPAEALSPREWDVLRLLSDGTSNREIAAKLKVSENTVKTHIKAVLFKLGLKNRTQAAAYAVLARQAFHDTRAGTDSQSRSA